MRRIVLWNLGEPSVRFSPPVATLLAEWRAAVGAPGLPHAEPDRAPVAGFAGYGPDALELLFVDGELAKHAHLQRRTLTANC